MHKKQLKRTLDSLQLQLVEFDLGTGNSAELVLEAPDGARNKFLISRDDDPGSDRVNIGQMRRFAQAHQRSDTLPGIAEIDVVMLNVTPKRVTDIELASRAVAYERDPHLRKSLAKRLAHEGSPINLDNVVVNGAAHSSVEPPPEPEPQPASAEAIERLIFQQPTNYPRKQKAMPRKNPLTLAKPTMTDATTPPAKPKRTIDRIGQVEFFRLCTVLNEIDMIGVSTVPKLAEKLTVAYGKRVAHTTAEDALKATGRKLDKVQVEVTDAQVIIARTLTALLIKLSEPVPDDLRRLCGEIE